MPQVKYSTFDQKLLSIYLAVQHFKHLLEGKLFYILCDHKPLTFAVARPSDTYSPRVQRQLFYISEFMTDIRHIGGVDNTVADVLSRSISTVSQYPLPLLDYKLIAITQETDEELNNCRINTSTLQLRPSQVPGTSLHLWCDVLCVVARPLTPRTQL